MYHVAMDYVSPLEALFPGVGSSVLAVLARADQPLTLRQIADRAGASHPQVSRHVDQFEALGVVRREVVGRSHLVILTRSAAADIVRRFDLLQEEVLAYMCRTASRLEPNAVSVVLFGSFARGTAGAGSDIDVAVVTRSEADELWLEQLGDWVDDVAVHAGNPVAEIVVARDELVERLDDPVWERIRTEGVLVTGAPIGELFDTVVAGAGGRR